MNNRNTSRRWFLMLAFGLIFVSPSSFAFAQTRSVPTQEYYLQFNQYYRGDYRRAVKDFISAERSAIKFGNQRYIDSICYWTMIGECYYQTGDYAKALGFYEQSIDLYLTHLRNDWQARVQPPPIIPPDNQAVNRARINWGTSARRFIVAKTPDSFSVLFGRMDAERAFQEGGLVQNPETRQVDISEIMRCTALAIYRRNVILGPTSKYSAISNRISAGLRSGAADGSLLGAYNGILQGIALASTEDWDAATRVLGSSLQFNGNMDHPLTGLGLLQLAQIGLATQSYRSAGQFALEASYTGAIFNQYDVVDDALSLASQMHTMQNSGGFAPLPNAIAWANRENANKLRVSLAIQLADSLAESGAVKESNDALALANFPGGRDTLSIPKVNGRIKYIQAVNQFQTGNFDAGMTSLQAALKSYSPNSLWLFRLGMSDSLAAAGGIGERQADLLYGSLLRDPNGHDWKLDPLEAISFLTSDHLAAIERWFEVAILRKDYERAIEIAELARRHRFFSQVPLGGRTLAFRWMLHSPVESLPSSTQEQRREFLTRYPQYQQWINRTEQINTALSLLPVQPDSGTNEFREQGKLFDELAEISQRQEAFLANCGLRRLPADMAFPPQYAISEYRNRLTGNNTAWVCFATASGYHRFLIRSNMAQYLGSIKERDVQKQVAGLLKKISASDPQVDASLLNDEGWKTTAKEAAQFILGEVPIEDLATGSELLIVPDGILWYFPFELAQHGDGESQKNLGDETDIRYSPTLFLAFDDRDHPPSKKRKAVVVSKVHLRGNLQFSEEAFKELATADSEVIKLDSLPKRTQPELLATLLDEVLVWSEIQLGKNHPLDFAPIALAPAPATPLRTWLLLPWRSPSTLVLPAFESDAGNGLRGKRQGMDLFVSTVGMMASGGRSITISRWRTGGENSLLLSRNYYERLGKMPSAKALRESIAIAREADLKYDAEPQIKFKKSDPVVKANHPFFWAGLMRLEVSDKNSVAIPDDDDPDIDDHAPTPEDDEDQ